MIRLLLLGPQEVHGDDGQPLHAVMAQPKRFGLLAYLVVEASRGPCRRDELLARFWPEADEARARRALTYALYFLRRELGRDIIVRHGAGDLAIDPAHVTSDVDAFEEAMRSGQFEQALALYRGDFMAGFYDADAPDLEQWADTRRLRFRERGRAAAWGLVEAAKQDAAPGAAAPADGIRWARRALELAPDDERALRELATFLHRAGDTAGMVAEYEHFARSYEELHGAPPSAQTRALIDDFRARPEPPPFVAPPIVVPAVPVVPVVPAVPVDDPRRGHRRQWLAAAGVTCAVAISSIALAFARAPTSRRADSASLVAVLPFAYHGAPELGYTSDGLTTLLAAGLDHLGALRAVNPRLLLGDARPRAKPVTPEDAAATARRFGAGEVVLGDITEAGGRLRVSATLFDDRARVLEGPIVIDGSADSLFDVVDRLTTRLAAQRVDASRGAPAAGLDGTRSIPALRAFLEGERDFRTGQYEAAIASYREAVTADTGFALALLRMSQAANWTGDGRLQKMADDRVQQLTSRLAPRDLQRAAAWHLSMVAPPERAESIYKTLVRDDPTDVEAWYYLADLVYHQGPAYGWPAAESRPAWERELALEPNDASALVHLVRLSAADGDTVAFDTLSRRLMGLSQTEDIAFELRALRAFSFGNARARAGVVRAAASRPAQLAVSIDIAGHVTGASYDATGVEGLWRAIDHDVPNAEEHGRLLLLRASVALAHGKLAEANALIDTAGVVAPSMSLRFRALANALPYLPSPPSSLITAQLARVRAAVSRGDTIAAHADAPAWRTFVLGIIAIRQGDVSAAARESGPLDALAASGHERAVQLAPLLRAEVAALDGRPAEALAALGPAPSTGMWLGDPSSGLASGEDRWLRASLLARVGRGEEALRLLASIPESTGCDVAYAPVAHLRQGELLEQMGDAREAAVHYRRALAYWRNADAELGPLVRRASAGLARVGSAAREGAVAPR